MKWEEFCNAKKNGFPIWNNLLCKRIESSYIKSFSMRTSLLCKKKEFSMWKKVFPCERWLVTLLSYVLSCKTEPNAPMWKCATLGRGQRNTLSKKSHVLTKTMLGMVISSTQIWFHAKSDLLPIELCAHHAKSC